MVDDFGPGAELGDFGDDVWALVECVGDGRFGEVEEVAVFVEAVFDEPGERESEWRGVEERKGFT